MTAIIPTSTIALPCDTCAACGDRLIGRDQWRGRCAWCEPAPTATCPVCHGSGSLHWRYGDGDESDDCPTCGGYAEIVTRAGAARKAGVA